MEPTRFKIANLSSFIDFPNTLTWPFVSLINPSSIRIVVDFPAPLGPKNPYIPPFGTRKSQIHRQKLSKLLC